VRIRGWGIVKCMELKEYGVDTVRSWPIREVTVTAPPALLSTLNPPHVSSWGVTEYLPLIQDVFSLFSCSPGPPCCTCSGWQAGQRVTAKHGPGVSAGSAAWGKSRKEGSDEKGMLWVLRIVLHVRWKENFGLRPPYLFWPLCQVQCVVGMRWCAGILQSRQGDECALHAQWWDN
jgi:hypothetical protein